MSNVHQLPLGNAPDTIGLGAKGEGVKALQQALNALRVTFIPVPETGEFDLDTSNAVKAFQVRAGIEPTGEVDAATKAKLQAAMPKAGIVPAARRAVGIGQTVQRQPLALWQMGLMVLGGLALVGGAYWMVTKDDEESGEGLSGTRKKDLVEDPSPSSHAVPLKTATPTKKCPRTPDDKALASGEVITA